MNPHSTKLGCCSSVTYIFALLLFCCFSEEALSELSSDLGVGAIPAFKFYKNGKEVLEPVTGYKKKLLRAAVEELQKA